MKISDKVVNKLNALLAGELSAMDIYLLQGRMLGDWGYSKLEERLVHESSDERGHADLIIQRILLLEGEPNMLARTAAAVGKTPQEMLEFDLTYELDVANALNEGIALCVAEKDNGTRELLEQLLVETESDHIFWLESQLKLIKAVGIQRYLTEQM